LNGLGFHQEGIGAAFDYCYLTIIPLFQPKLQTCFVSPNPKKGSIDSRFRFPVAPNRAVLRIPTHSGFDVKNVTLKGPKIRLTEFAVLLPFEV